MAFQDVRDAVARVIGGTVDPNNPRRFSGVDAGDTTGVANINYAYSTYVEVISNPPCAIVLSDTFEVTPLAGGDVLTQGNEIAVDDLRVVVLVSRAAPEQTDLLVANLRDDISAAFRSHLGLFGTAAVVQAYVKRGRAGHIAWGGADYLGWELTVRVIRDLTPTYTA